MYSMDHSFVHLDSVLEHYFLSLSLTIFVHSQSRVVGSWDSLQSNLNEVYDSFLLLFEDYECSQEVGQPHAVAVFMSPLVVPMWIHRVRSGIDSGRHFSLWRRGFEINGCKRRCDPLY